MTTYIFVLLFIIIVLLVAILLRRPTVDISALREDNARLRERLADMQTKHLDPIIEGIIAKKKLSLVIDGRMARIGTDVENLDITNEVVKALDKKVSKAKMETPKGF